MIYAWHGGIAVRHGGNDLLPPGRMIHSVTIENCVTYQTGSSGIFLKNVRNVDVRDNVVGQAVLRFGQECITLWNVWGFDVDNNTVQDRPDIPGRRGGEGIDAKDGTRNGKIRNNRVVDVYRHAIYIDGYDLGCRNIEVFNNFVRNSGPGLSVASERGGLVWNINMHGNVVTECNAWLFFGPHQEGYSHPVRYVRVAFNTFVRNNGYGINIANEDLRTVRINNNVIVDNDGMAIRLRDGVNKTTIGLRVLNNVMKSGSQFDTGNRTVDDDTQQLYVQQFASSDAKWDDPEHYYVEVDSPALDNGWNTWIGDPVRVDGRLKRFDIAGYQRRSPGYMPPLGKQDIGARERH